MGGHESEEDRGAGGQEVDKQGGSNTDVWAGMRHRKIQGRADRKWISKGAAILVDGRAGSR